MSGMAPAEKQETRGRAGRPYSPPKHTRGRPTAPDHAVTWPFGLGIAVVRALSVVQIVGFRGWISCLTVYGSH